MKPSGSSMSASPARLIARRRRACALSPRGLPWRRARASATTVRMSLATARTAKPSRATTHITTSTITNLAWLLFVDGVALSPWFACTTKPPTRIVDSRAVNTSSMRSYSG
eukprot:Amastigsp_a676903_9.p4 type:complete len:111 gc:universal Amastigsp_a676903_9:147-479(+)